MKQAYYYFLFRIFRFYKDRYKEGDKSAIWSVICVSTTCIGFNLLTVYFFFDFVDILPMFSNKYWAMSFMIGVGIVNYLFFIKDKKFLNCGFIKDRKGGAKIIAYFIISVAISIVIANFNREKIFAERRANPPTEEVVPQNSLERQIRDWWNNRKK